MIVVPGHSPSLMGRNWLEHIQLDWPTLSKTEQPVKLNQIQIIKQHEAVFNSNMGLFKSFKVDIPIDTSATPKFCKARPVPHALKEKIDVELDHLVKEGIYEPVEYSKWASPTVPVKKADITVRLCGDYKQTINQAALCIAFYSL